MLPRPQLRRARTRVTRIDTLLIRLLAERFKVTRHIQSLKQAIHIPVHQKKRENTVLTRALRLGKANKLSTTFIKRLFSLIFSYSKKDGIIK